MYVLDTNTLIYFFRGEGNVAQRLLSEPPYTIGLPVIVLYELRVGILTSNSPEKLMRYLEDIRQSAAILEFGEKEADSAAEIRAQLEKKGTPIGPYDILIAGICRAQGGILVTRNVGEFSRVEDLRTEDWY
ncbi:MAG: type II toxin-antitoxin system VapC family toxin [Spirochaetia bacterium]